MQRRDFLARMAAAGALSLLDLECALGTTPAGNERHLVPGSADAMFHLTQEGGFHRITIGRSDMGSAPFGLCRFEPAGFRPVDTPVLDFWVRVQGSHSVALNFAFGSFGLGYGSGPPYDKHATGHILNLVGTQLLGMPIRTVPYSMGDLGPINDGQWHHIVYDVAYAIQTRLGLDPATVSHSGLSLYTYNDGALLYAGGWPLEPIPTTVDLREMLVRQRREGEECTNDLMLDARCSSLGGDQYLVAGCVISRRGLSDAVVAVTGSEVRQPLNAVKDLKHFSMVIAVPRGTSKLRVELRNEGKTVKATELAVPTALEYLQDATIHLMPASHEDLAVIDTPANANIFRRERNMEPAIRLMEENPDYCYSMELTIALMDYFDHKPLEAERIVKLIREGRICFGATYNQPYYSLFGGESLLRQFYFGRKWLLETLGNDVQCTTCWNTDTTESILQLPQILAKSGVKHMLLGRFRPGLFNWYSPDGSKVMTCSLGIYGLTAEFCQPFTCADVALKAPMLLGYWDKFYREHKIPAHMPVTDQSDFLPPTEEFLPLVHEWVKGGGKQLGSRLNLKFSTVEQCMHAITSDPAAEFPELRGEWVTPWTYVVPAVGKMIAIGREASWLLTSAEKLWALRYMASWKLAEPYQRATFDDAWKAHMHVDHGPTGLNGDVVDSVFLEEQEQARGLGQALLDSVSRWIAERTKPLDSASMKMVVLNPLSWERSGPVLVEIPTPEGQEPEIQDEQGRLFSNQPVPQVPGGTTRYIVQATDVPSIGYATLKVQFKPRKQKAADSPESFQTKTYENAFYRIEFAPGGLKSIYDKELQKELLDVRDFLGGEILSLDSVGEHTDGTGGQGTAAQPSWERIERASQYAPSWRLIEGGPVRTGWRMQQAFREATVRMDVYAYEHSKRLEFEAAILHWSGAVYKEFRLVMPLAMPDAEIAYDVPFAVFEAGKDELRGAPFPGDRGGDWPGGWDDFPTESVHPRYVQNWIAAGDGKHTVAMSSVSSSWDYLDGSRKKDRYTPLQPILLASRRAGHSQSNFFSPPGDYHYKFGLTSFAGGWRNNFHFGDEMNCPFPALVITSMYGWEKDRVRGYTVSPQPPMTPIEGPIGEGSAMLVGNFPQLDLPSRMSACTVSSPNYVVSDMKVADDNRGFIVRGYEVAGQAGVVKLTLPLKDTRANITNLIEEDVPEELSVSEGAVELQVGHRAIHALRVQGEWKG